MLEPTEASHRLRAAGVLLRQGKAAEARVEAQAALTLADTDEERREAERLLESATKRRERRRVTAGACRRHCFACSPPLRHSASVRMDLPRADKRLSSPGTTPPAVGSCRRSRPNARRRMVAACGFAGFLYERGRGVTADAARAASFYQQSCDAGDRMGCVGFALLQARGNGIPKDAAKAQATLTELCTDGVLEACTQLAVLIVPGGTAADLTRARELLTKACDGKHARACELLKSMPKAPK